MKLKYTSRTGHFNLLNHSEISVSCHIQISDDDGKNILSTSVRPEYEINGNDPDEAIEILEDTLNRVWISTSKQEWREMIEFLKNNKDEILKGNTKARLSEIENIIENLQKEKQSLLNLF